MCHQPPLPRRRLADRLFLSNLSKHAYPYIPTPLSLGGHLIQRLHAVPPREAPRVLVLRGDGELDAELVAVDVLGLLSCNVRWGRVRGVGIGVCVCVCECGERTREGEKERGESRGYTYIQNHAGGQAGRGHAPPRRGASRWRCRRRWPPKCRGCGWWWWRWLRVCACVLGG